MTTVEEIISDDQIDAVHGNASFGISKREVVRLGVLKCASGYYQGFTSQNICKEHGLIDENYKLTEKGRKYLWASNGSDF